MEDNFIFVNMSFTKKDIVLLLLAIDGYYWYVVKDARNFQNFVLKIFY